MAESRDARSRFYDGALYARAIDPLLSNLHGFAAKQVPPGLRVLEAGCGTGDLAFRIAAEAREVVGVELSPRMVDYATRRAAERELDNVDIVLGDVSTVLSDCPDGSFDLGLTVLVLHEMPHAARGPVLRELTRLAERVLCIDFRVPMPWNVAGLRNRALELAAGREHFGGFRDYTRRGGIPGLAAEAGLQCAHIRDIDGGTVAVCELRR